MMSEVAFFVKDVVGPEGLRQHRCLRTRERRSWRGRVEHLLLRHRQPHQDQRHPASPRGAPKPDNSLARADELFRMDDEPGHDELCAREQSYLLRAITQDLDLTDHMNDAVNSLRIVLAAEESIRTKQVVTL